ncbi:calcium-binding protein [Pseudothauera lacus]|uniref:Dystroglycan-type cadherin-like domain-containing protein n=1 Tax=Pseudothauera lacus TaxID=2136175 RepID=A0A2T4IF96_9RHOO|nr:calcium-binding protein [Pseudothauera lacus]PTD96445.1 hypothetical protein C8261_09020 [Pseudothauera lacus]
MSEARIVWQRNPEGARTWTYGYWGGGGWSNGQFTSESQSVDPSGPVADQLDQQFKDHDLAYDSAIRAWKSSDQTLTAIHNFWDAIIAADRAMLDGIHDLRRNGDLGNPPGLGSTSETYIAAKDAAQAFDTLMVPANEAARASNLSPDRLGDVSSLTGNRWDRYWAVKERETVERLLRISDTLGSAPIPQWIPSWDSFERGLLDRLLRLSKNLDDIFRRIGDQTQTASRFASPVILDLDGTGINTVGLDAGVYFDHAADGFAERTGWLGAGDGLLVWDRNGDGAINSGRELFGSETVLASGLKAVNGFEALRELDINGDGVIDANDPAFAELRVWVDANVDGRTGEGELLTLEEAGVQAINVTYSHSNHVDAHGNAHKQVGSFVTTGGETRTAADVWFVKDAAYSIPTEWLEVPEEIALLPDARGYGKVHDLHQAMVRDDVLKGLVERFVAETDGAERNALMPHIIYRWAGVDGVHPASRTNRGWGNAIGDARRLEALEAFLGQAWSQRTWGSNPGRDAARTLNQAYGQLEAMVFGQLMAQSHLKDLFLDIRYGWDEETASIVGDLSEVAASLAGLIERDRGYGLEQLGEFVRSVRGLGLAGTLDMLSFKTMMAPLGEDVSAALEAPLVGWVDSNSATEGNDILRGTELDDFIDGRGGNDLILGRGGNDTLIGGAGNDTLDGGAGNDELRGGTGSDTYRFGRGDGHDTIIEDSWHAGEVDRIELKAGVAPADVRLARMRDPNNWRSVDDLVLSIADTGETITVRKHFAAGSRHAIEEIVFADGTVWDSEAIFNRVLSGGDGDDVIYGIAGRDNLIAGGRGNDTLFGASGNDTLDGGVGNDELRGGSGSDTYRFGRGDGNDVIFEDSWLAADIDRIELKAGVAPTDVRLQRVRDQGNWWNVDDLVLTIVDTGETITVKKHFVGGHRYGVEEIVFSDGTVWDAEAIRSRVLIGSDGDDTLQGHVGRDNSIVGNGGNDTLLGRDGNDTLSGGAGDDLLMGGKGDDLLIAGPGSDTLRGGSGSDTYRFGLGDGFNVIEEGYDRASVDTIELADGIAPADVTVRYTRSGDMMISLHDGTKVFVRSQASYFAANDGVGVEQLRFADGTVWDRSALDMRAVVGTDGDDRIVSGYDNDILDGGAGNDTYVNLGGYDTYVFGMGDGDDSIEGGRGKVVFKPGVDQLGVSFAREDGDLVATIDASGDSVRIGNWFGTWSGGRIERFEFSNGAILSAANVTALVGVHSDSEILYGSPADDLITGSDKHSTLYGREGADTLVGGGGNNQLYGEAGDDLLLGGAGRDTLYGGDGDDTLNGGAGRDQLYGGAGSNAYIIERGSGLDSVYAANATVADDTVLFGPGIRVEDINVQMGARTWGILQPGDVGYSGLVIGLGGDDAVIIRSQSGGDLGRAAVRRFRFDDGTEFSLEEMIARADGGVMGYQVRHGGDPTLLLGSAADDQIEDYTGESVVIRAGANNDNIVVLGGDNIVSAGSGDDTVYGGFGDDLIAGESGNDVIDGGAGDDTFLFNYGDGDDVLTAGDGVDTLSFGGGITPIMLGAYLAADGRLVLVVDGGLGGSIVLEGSTLVDLSGDLERVQFIDAEGRARIFDLAAWANAQGAELRAASATAPLAFVATDFELTGTVAPAGGLEAVAYAQSGDMFGGAALAHNTPTAGDDVIYGTAGVDAIDAGAGNDIVIGLAGDDILLGGDGDDLLYGGDGDDWLEGGAGNDTLHGGHGADTLRGGPGRDELYGGWGGDTYVYHTGDEEVVIDDEHRPLRGGHGVGEGPDIISPSAAPQVSAVDWDSSGDWDYVGDWDYDDPVFDDAPNILQFGEGIRPEDLRYSERDGDLVIEFADRPGDRVILRGYAPHRATLTRSVDVFRFADGSEIAAEGIEVSGVTQSGGDEGAWLTGTMFADTLVGGDGDDHFASEGGSDLLVGGIGSDTYHIHREGGTPAAHVTIVETWREGDFNRLELTGDVDADDLQLAFDGRDLLLVLGEDGGSVRFAGFDPRVPGMQPPINEVDLSWTGEVLSFEALVARGIRYGERSEDIYAINIGDGEVNISDSASSDAGNTVRFGPGITPESLQERLSFAEDGEGGHRLLVLYGGEGDVLRLAGFNRDDVLGGGHAVEHFLFADGTVVDYATLVSWGFSVEGDEGGNTIQGSNLDDRLYGHGGDDVLIGGEGFNRFHGGRGNDTLIGGAGVDAYHFELGDGVDTIIDDPSDNFIVFGAGILLEELTLGWDGETLLIHYGPGDTIRLPDFHANMRDGMPAVMALAFDDGRFASLPAMLKSAPVVGASIAPVEAVQDAPFRVALPAGAFEDPFGGSLTLHARMADGSPLPAWLLFDSARGVFSGTPRNDDVGDLDIVVEAWDEYGFSVTQDMRVTVHNVNDAPTAGVLLSDQTGQQRAAWAWQLPDGAFHDIDPGDQLTLSATLADGTALPDWLSFDASASAFIGTPPAAGEYAIQVTATDLAGASASQTFVLHVEAAEDAHSGPVTLPDAATVQEDRTLLAWGNVLANDSHPDSATLCVTDAGVRRGEYGWLTLLPNGGYAYMLDNFSPKVQGLGVGESAEERFGYLASDGQNVTPGELVVSVHGTNDAPELARRLSNVQLARGREFSWQIPEGSFTDRDLSDVLSYSATLTNGQPLPKWLAFDAETRSFSGTAPATARGSLDIRVVASDGHGNSSVAADSFRVSFGNRTVYDMGGGNCFDALLPGNLPGNLFGAWGGSQTAKTNRNTGQDVLEQLFGGSHGNSNGAGSLLAALSQSVPAGLLDPYWQAPTPARTAAAAVQHQWRQLQEALARLDAERQASPMWQDRRHGADLGGLAGLVSGNAALNRLGADTVGLLPSGGQLKAFSGLHEGVIRLPC